VTGETSTTRGIGRRALLRNGLLTGLGVTVAGLTIASPAHAATPGPSSALSGTASARATARLARLTAAADPQIQDNWRWCGKCEGLFYGGHQSTSNCPTGGTHDGSGSYDYQLFYLDPPVSASDIQPNWRWCGKCEGLFYGGHQSTSNCPTGGTHDGSGSYDYHLFHDDDVLAYEQPNWRWCGKCEGLFYGGHQSTSNCPTGGAHDGSGSYNYILDYA
jgi:hypothetical protein